MATGDVALGQQASSASAHDASKRVINDFSIQVATVNGSGSQSANSVLGKNMIYVGVAARRLSLDRTAVEAALRRQFAKKQKAADLNWAAVQAGYNYAAESLPKRDPYVLERMHAAEGKIIIDGNAAAALGAMFAGVTVVTWYPITP